MIVAPLHCRKRLEIDDIVDGWHRPSVMRSSVSSFEIRPPFWSLRSVFFAGARVYIKLLRICLHVLEMLIVCHLGTPNSSFPGPEASFRFIGCVILFLSMMLHSEKQRVNMLIKLERFFVSWRAQSTYRACEKLGKHKKKRSRWTRC